MVYTSLLSRYHLHTTWLVFLVIYNQDLSPPPPISLPSFPPSYEEMAQSCYTPLDSKLPQIRLLKVHPLEAEGNDRQIKCSMDTVYLQDFIDNFAALSYTWGDQQNSTVIIINSYPRRVGHNVKHSCGVAAEGRRTPKFGPLGTIPLDRCDMH